MKRPLAFFGFTLFAVLLCLNLFNSTAFSVSLLVLAAVLFVVSISVKKSRQSLILPTVIGAVITGCLLLLLFESYYDRTLSFTGENITVEGEIAESPYFSEENCRYYCVIKVKSLNSQSIKTKMRLSFSETNDGIDPDNFNIGDKIALKATVYQMGSFSLPIKQYFKSQGIYLGAYSVKDLTITERKFKTVGYYIDLLRDKITENLLHDFDNDVASLLIALLTGDKSFMSDSLYESFVKSGVVHIMAVSGLHLSIWVAFLSFFIDLKGKKGKFAAVLMIGFTVFMMNFAFFTGSVKRAAAMTILYFIGKIFGKKTDSLNSLGFAAVCALSVNPFGILDISFMLSFLATLGIIVLGVPLGEKLMKKLKVKNDSIKKLISPFVMTFAISISVSIFTFPVCLFYFGGISLAAPLTNLLFLLAVSPCLLLTGLYSFLRFVPFLSPISAVIIKYLALYMIKTAEYIASLPFSYLDTDFESLKYWLILAFILLITGLGFYNISRFFTKVFSILTVSVFLLSLGVNFYFSLDRCKITVFDDDCGSCAVVSLNGRGVLLGFEGDSYSENEIADETENQNIKIDCAVFFSDIITRSQKNLCHSLGIENVITSEGTSVTLFDKVTLTKGETAVTVKAENIKTYIFYQEPLQHEDRYDIITADEKLIDGEYENSYVFTVGEKRPFTVIIKGENITVRGESSWLNLMKKA